jgi:hypothetical protein
METSSPTGGELREELRGDASTVTDATKQRLFSEADARKGGAATQAKSLSGALDAAADELADSPSWLRSAFHQGAQTLNRFADTLENKDSRQLTRDIQKMARDHPGTFLTGCALAGFAAARVLKAGVEDTSPSGARVGETPQNYDPYEQQQTSPTGTAFAGLEDSESGAQSAYQGEM